MSTILSTVPSSKIELFVEVLNTYNDSFSSNDSLLWHYKNNYAINIMFLTVSVFNSMELLVLLAKLFAIATNPLHCVRALNFLSINLITLLR